MPLPRPSSTPAFAKAGRQTYRLKWLRLIGLCSRLVNTRRSSPGGWRRRCSETASATESGSGTTRTLPPVGRSISMRERTIFTCC